MRISSFCFCPEDLAPAAAAVAVVGFCFRGEPCPDAGNIGNSESKRVGRSQVVLIKPSCGSIVVVVLLSILSPLSYMLLPVHPEAIA